MENLNGLNFTKDNELSNNFQYNESISAAYVNFKSRINQQLAYNIGVRSEYTNYKLQYSSAALSHLVNSQGKYGHESHLVKTA